MKATLRAIWAMLTGRATVTVRHEVTYGERKLTRPLTDPERALHEFMDAKGRRAAASSVRGHLNHATYLLRDAERKYDRTPTDHPDYPDVVKTLGKCQKAVEILAADYERLKSE